MLEAARIPGEGPEGVLPGRVECAALHPAAEGQGPLFTGLAGTAERSRWLSLHPSASLQLLRGPS